nr:hypothetical protein [Tanacetum cinerariifolium]
MPETFLNITSENKAHFDAEKEAIHLLLTGIGVEIYSTVDTCKTAHDMWIAIKRLQQDSMESYYSRFYKMMNEMIIIIKHQNLKDHMHLHQNNLLPPDLMFLQNAKSKEIAKPITPPSELAFEEDSDPKQAHKYKEMHKYFALIAMYFKKLYKPTNNNLRTSSNSRKKNMDTSPRYVNENHTRKSKREKDYTYHKEKMLLCKQAKKGVLLQEEQADLLEDMDEEINKQELEAHYIFMAKIQEVLPVDSRSDVKPLEKAKQNVEECDDECVALANLIANLTLDTEENKMIVQLILLIVDSRCTKHMTGNLKLLSNFVEKFFSTIWFGNDQFSLILGFGDLVQGNVTIKQVALRKSTCFVKDLQGNDLLTSNRVFDLYTIPLHESTSLTLICFMAKASSTQAWLWHRRLSHLNFDYINLLSKKDIVIGLPKLKYVKGKLCSSSELSKAEQSSFKTKQVFILFALAWMDFHKLEIMGDLLSIGVQIDVVGGVSYCLELSVGEQDLSTLEVPAVKNSSYKGPKSRSNSCCDEVVSSANGETFCSMGIGPELS